MKRAIAVSVLFAFVLSLAAPVFALPAPVDKLKGGMEGIIKSPLELPKTTIDEVKGADFKPFGLVGGLMKGTYNMVHSSLKGVVDVVTFPIK